MEKFCPRCGRVLGEVDFNFCPYCKTELKERVGRQPIPGYLRHEVFKRDNYKCVECGATNKETTLEIDHIIPVAKGGTNDINNLQTLCRECNRAKNATFWNEKDLKLKIDLIEEQIDKLKNQIIEYEDLKNSSLSEEEEIDINYQIYTNSERVNELIDELESLKFISEENEKNNEKRMKEDLVYKKLYVKDSNVLEFLFKEFSVPEDLSNKNAKLRFLVEHYDEYEIEELIIEDPKKAKLLNQLYDEDSLVLQFLFWEFSIPEDLINEKSKIRFLVENYNKSKISNSLKKYQKRLILYNELSVKDMDILEFLFWEFRIPKNSEEGRLILLVYKYNRNEINRAINKYLKPKTKKDEELERLNERRRKQLIIYVNKLSINNSLKVELINNINEDRITTKSEISKRVIEQAKIKNK